MKQIWKLIEKAIVLVALLSSADIAVGQSTGDWDAAQRQMSRKDLEQLLQRFEGTAESTAYSREMRARARQEGALIRARLEEGDFQVGDRVVLVVEGEEQLTNTFSVGRDRILTLPVIGDIPMQGVLRSELESHLTEHIGRQIRNPVVHAQSLIRVSIFGAVGKPGFYLVPSSQLLTESVMEAGGPSGTASLEKLYVERAGQRIWEGQALQDAIIEGRTLDQLSLRAGDRIVVPAQANQRQLYEIAWTVSALSSLIFLVARLF